MHNQAKKLIECENIPVLHFCVKKLGKMRNYVQKVEFGYLSV